MESFGSVAKINGELEFKGDKSISHRAVIFASLAKGKSSILNLSLSEDVRSSRSVFQSLGIDISETENALLITGKGYKGFTPPSVKLDSGNSGTTARLISGLLINQNFASTITGDESLSKRPMKRIIDPLRLMGGILQPTNDNFLPLSILPSDQLHPITYPLPIASAQIKSAIALSALHLEDETTIIETLPSRNHTELMLGLSVEKGSTGTSIRVSKKNYPQPFEMTIPGDVSSAAFFIVLTLILPNSELHIKNISLNPERSRYITLLKEMGGSIEIEETGKSLGESIGNILVKSSKIKNISIPADAVPLIIDEIPILAICGIFAEGDFEIFHAKELRVKESDRITAMVHNLRLAGLEVEEFPDGFAIREGIPGKPAVNPFESFGDHRIAMAFAVLSCIFVSGGSVNNFSCANISNPEFINQLKSITR